MVVRHWSPDGDTARGTVLLIHGISSITTTWWQIGPALAERGWSVTAVDQAGHGGRTVQSGTFDELVDTVLEQHPAAPDVLVGHSLGSLTALLLAERTPGWAGTVLLEDPPSIVDDPRVVLALQQQMRDDAALLQRDRAALTARIAGDSPRWATDDVYWSVEALAQTDLPGLDRLFDNVLSGEHGRFDIADRILGTHPVPWVLAATDRRPFSEGGTALVEPDRSRLEQALPAGHFIGVEGGHSLHRDNPEAWLAAFDRITG